MGEQDPNELIKRANQCYEQGKYEEAIALYRHAISLAPNSPIYTAYNFVVGEMLMNLGHHQEAAQVFNEVVAKTPEHDQAWCDLGQCLMAIGEYHEAAHAFARCLEMAPETAEAWYYGAMAHARLGREEQAREHLQRALGLKPAWKKQAQSNPLLKDYLPQHKPWWKLGG